MSQYIYKFRFPTLSPQLLTSDFRPSEQQVMGAVRVMVTCDCIYIDQVSHLKFLASYLDFRYQYIPLLNTASYFGIQDSQRNRLWAPASRLHPPLLQKLYRPILAFCLASFVLVTVQVQRLFRPLVHIQFNTFQLTGTFISAEIESHSTASSSLVVRRFLPRPYTFLRVP